ncbi:MAG: metallophosphoesterase [Deltaproteobacteria bacterium]|nr:metallophosphoesterase [Deltaproteobacteria bacterium]
MRPSHSPFKEYVRQLHHKKTVRAITTATIVVGLPVIGAYSCLLATRRLKLERLKITIANEHADLAGLKIIQLSDLHYGPTNRNNRYFNRAIDIVNALNPDLIVLTGDYYQWDPDYIHQLPAMLSRMRAPLGIFGCFGNHDYGSCYPGKIGNDPIDYRIVKHTFDKNNITILTNETIRLQYRGQGFNLTGLHDLWSGMFDPIEAFEGVNTHFPTIVLSHNPDTAGLVERGYDLMLSGHSHGGQVSWPLIGSLTTPMIKKHFRRGLHRISERKQIYVNRGLGHTFKMRFNSPPEISLIEIG